MGKRSINDRINLILVIILILVAILFADFYLGWRLDLAEERGHAILTIETQFYDALFMENTALVEPDQKSLLETRYNELLAKLGMLGMNSAKTHLLARKQLFEEWYELQDNSSKLYLKVQNLLPNLVDSVRYIHRHHLTYMKNLLSRNVYSQDYDVGGSFARSQVKAAPELDIIGAAVAIQTSLLDIFNCFYELQRGYAPALVKDKFSDRIQYFFNRVNTFEDFSLDAQDGLLVEELLKDGRSFQEWFTNLLNLEQDKSNHSISLVQNRIELLETLHATGAQIDASTHRLRLNIRTLQIAMLGFAVLLALYILYSGKHIAKEFRRTVDETERIRNDTSFQIESKADDFEEFRIVFSALNSMARTINAQIRILEESQDKLSRQVAERTAEIVSANEQLKKEIADRVRAEEIRENLEAQLHRAQKMEAIGTLAGGLPMISTTFWLDWSVIRSLSYWTFRKTTRSGAP